MLQLYIMVFRFLTKLQIKLVVENRQNLSSRWFLGGCLFSESNKNKFDMIYMHASLRVVNILCASTLDSGESHWEGR